MLIVESENRDENGKWSSQKGSYDRAHGTFMALSWMSCSIYGLHGQHEKIGTQCNEVPILPTRAAP